ncbi:MAG: hypothetical protein QOH61_1071 [Chloroflexota bacterium]|nr:hypothetical protein [Chloroflexota bacterium]
MKQQPDPSVQKHLQPDEELLAHARAVDAHISATDRRLIVVTNDRLAVAVPYDRLRRIQFDLERTRPATLVIVPEYPSDPPQVLGIPIDEVEGVADMLTILAERFETVA